VQTAVDNAGDGDVIKVATGTYNDIQARDGVTQVVYISKSVTIRGGYTTDFVDPPDPEAHLTTLDAMGQGRVFYITGEVSPTIEGLRIIGGDATGLGGGPGVYDGAGGGFYVASATATISNCAIYNNVAGGNGWGTGGGVYLWRSPSHLTHNTIHGNVASEGTYGTEDQIAGEGGGVSVSESDAVLTGNTIEWNTASSIDYGIGGGVYIEGGNVTLRDNVVWHNTASASARGDGGGIYNGPPLGFCRFDQYHLDHHLHHRPGGGGRGW